MNNRNILLGLISVLASGASWAAGPGIAAELGTTGVGAHLTFPVLESLNARFGVNYLNYTFDGSTSDLNYDFRLKLQTFDVPLDYFPVDRSKFRLSGGLIVNGNRVNAKAKPDASGNYTINGNSYPASLAGSLEGNVDFRSTAPYLGIGWGNAAAANQGWSFTTDLGVIFQGSPRPNLKNSGCTAPAAACSELAADLETENSKLKNELNNFKAYPVVRIGLSYHF